MSAKLIVICGPTASGKSAIAIEVAKALNTEIISADSLAIYKKLDIGTAKPTREELEKVTHHLIDVVEPKDNFSVSDFEALAIPIIERLLREGKNPVICGGTGFYVNSILYKLSYGETEANLEVREKYQKLYNEKGAEYVFEELRKVDPKSCEKLHCNDVKRVIRALEIYYSTGKRKSDQQDKLIPRFDYIAVTPNVSRETLYNRIEKRVDQMLEKGLVSEVQSLISEGVTLDNQCMQGIGYKETYEAIKAGDFSELANLIKLNTRHYAKRQITFFKRLEGLKMVNQNPEIATKEIIELLK